MWLYGNTIYLFLSPTSWLLSRYKLTSAGLLSTCCLHRGLLSTCHKCYQWQWVEVSSVQGAGVSGTTDRSELELETWLWSWLKQLRQFQMKCVFFKNKEYSVIFMDSPKTLHVGLLCDIYWYKPIRNVDASSDCCESVILIKSTCLYCLITLAALR